LYVFVFFTTASYFVFGALPVCCCLVVSTSALSAVDC